MNFNGDLEESTQGRVGASSPDPAVRLVLSAANVGTCLGAVRISGAETQGL